MTHDEFKQLKTEVEKEVRSTIDAILAKHGLTISASQEALPYEAGKLISAAGKVADSTAIIISGGEWF